MMRLPGGPVRRTDGQAPTLRSLPPRRPPSPLLPVLGLLSASFPFSAVQSPDSMIGIRRRQARADGLAPVVELAAEILGRVGPGGGQVAGFARIVREVIELDVVVLEEFQELPVA